MNLIHYKKKTVRWQNVEQLKWMHCGSKVTKQSKDQCIKVYLLRVLACIAICFHADNSVWMCVPPRCIKHSTFQNVWRPHHAQPAEYLQIAIYHYFLSYSHLMPVMSRYNFVLKILFVTLFDIVFSCSTIHELPSGLPLSCVLQKPRMDLADTYTSFVRQNQDILHRGVSDELYIETVFDVSASTVSSLLKLCSYSYFIVIHNFLC